MCTFNTLKYEIIINSYPLFLLADQQVKNIFYQIQKAKARHNSELIRKYLTTNGFQQLDELINHSPKIQRYTTAILTEVSVIGLSAKSNKHSDRLHGADKSEAKRR
jgi:hypothetical protein